MRERSVLIVNELGLHARAAAQLVKLAAKFSSRIELTREDTGVTANAKSILSVLQLAAGKGIMVRVTVEGEDETEAALALEDMFLKGFCEMNL